MKKDRRGINPASKPSGDGCVEYLASPKGWWFHLRRCAECGHIGCCDSSPSQHASKHAAETGHRIIASFEPGEDWFYDYKKQGMIKGAQLLPPHSHPEDQPIHWARGKSSSKLGISAALASQSPHFQVMCVRQTPCTPRLTGGTSNGLQRRFDGRKQRFVTEWFE